MCNPLTDNNLCLGEAAGAAGDALGGAAGGVADAVAENTIQKLADSVADAVADGLASLGTLWVNIDTPELAGGSEAGRNAGAVPPGSRGVATVLEYAMYVGLTVCVVSLMVAGVRLARNASSGLGDDDDAARIGTVLGGTILISGAVAIVSALFGGGRPAGGSATVGFVQNSLWYYTMGIAVLSVIFAGIRMAWEQRAQPGKDLVRSVLTLILIVGAALPVLGLLLEASDGFSRWVIMSSLDCDPTVGDGSCFRDNLSGLLQLSATTGGGLGAPFMVIVLGLIALLTSLIQIMLMVARSGMLVVLAGVLPWTAAATNTETGMTWFKRALAWLLAWLLYKPAAAIVYATAFHLSGSDLFTDDGTGLIKVLTGLMLMIMAVVALPALMRFVTPAVSSMASGAGGGMAMAAAAVPAMGAVSAVGRMGAGGAEDSSSAGAPGAAGTQGASGATGAVGHGGGGIGGSEAGGGPGGSGTRGGGKAPAGAPASGGPGAAGGGSAGGGSAAAAGAGPAGAAVAAADGVMKAGEAARGAVESTAQSSTGDEGGTAGSTGGASGAAGAGRTRNEGDSA